MELALSQPPEEAMALSRIHLRLLDSRSLSHIQLKVATGSEHSGPKVTVKSGGQWLWPGLAPCWMDRRHLLWVFSVTLVP